MRGRAAAGGRGDLRWEIGDWRWVMEIREWRSKTSHASRPGPSLIAPIGRYTSMKAVFVSSALLLSICSGCASSRSIQIGGKVFSQAENSLALDFSKGSGMRLSEVREVLSCVVPCGRQRSSTIIDISRVESAATFDQIEQHLKSRLGFSQRPQVGIYGINACDPVSAQLAVTTGHGPPNEMVGDIYYLSKLANKWKVVRHAFWESEAYGSRGRDRLTIDYFVITVGDDGDIEFLEHSYDIREIASALNKAGLSKYSPIEVQAGSRPYRTFVTFINLCRLLKEHGYERVRERYISKRSK